MIKHVKPKQSLGQNFLTDVNVARNIVNAINPKEGEVLIEIGPGKGALTKHLVTKPSTLFAFEIDGRIVESLQAEYNSKTVHITHQDFLEADLLQISKNHGKKIRIVGNIPYHLTSEIMFKVIDERLAVRDVTLMIQREVAQRMTALPRTKAYGILSVLCQFYGKPSILFTVSPNCFYPVPDVTSAVFAWTLHDNLPYSVDDKKLRLVVRTTFGKRRKMLRNSLQFLPFEPERIEYLLSKLTFDVTRRPEELSIEQFVQLTNEIDSILLS